MEHQGERSEGRSTEEGIFCVTQEELVDRIVVRVVGDLDMATALELRSALRPDNRRPIVIDLAETTFIDSSGLNALVAACHHGTVIALRHPSPTVRRAIEISGLDEILTIEA